MRYDPSSATAEVIAQRIGVDEDRITSRQVSKNHGASGGGGKSRSGSLANRSASSALPFQPQMPWVAWTQLPAG